MVEQVDETIWRTAHAVITAPPRLTGGRKKLSDGTGQPIDGGRRRPCGRGVVLEDQVVGQNDAIAFLDPVDFMGTIGIESDERETLVGTADAHLGPGVRDRSGPPRETGRQ